jgi:hypothetical protein
MAEPTKEKIPFEKGTYEGYCAVIKCIKYFYNTAV